MAPEVLRDMGVSGAELRALDKRAGRASHYSEKNSNSKKTVPLEKKWEIQGKWAGESARVIPTKDLKQLIAKMKAAGLDAGTYERELAKRK